MKFLKLGVQICAFWHAEPVAWSRGTVVERRSWPANFPCLALDLQLIGNHFCG